MLNCILNIFHSLRSAIFFQVSAVIEETELKYISSNKRASKILKRALRAFENPTSLSGEYLYGVSLPGQSKDTVSVYLTNFTLLKLATGILKTGM